jgi:hypothetical protein
MMTTETNTSLYHRIGQDRILITDQLDSRGLMTFTIRIVTLPYSILFVTATKSEPQEDKSKQQVDDWTLQAAHQNERS